MVFNLQDLEKDLGVRASRRALPSAVVRRLDRCQHCRLEAPGL